MMNIKDKMKQGNKAQFNRIFILMGANIYCSISPKDSVYIVLILVFNYCYCTDKDNPYELDTQQYYVWFGLSSKDSFPELVSN